MSLIHYRNADGINDVPVSEATPLPIEVVDVGGDVTITGDAVVDTTALEALVGALDASAETDPDAASASLNALLRGILTELQAQTALLTTIAAG